MIDLMLDVRPGDIISMEILRDGTEMTVEFTITQEIFVAY